LGLVRLPSLFPSMLLTPLYRRTQDPARLPSITVQSILSECDSDVLLLYDCCHAIPTTTGITGRGVKEFLAACGFEGIAPEVGRDSFTHALIQELGKASYSSVSIGELYGRLIDRLRTWKPCISKNEFGQMRFNSYGKPLYERSKRKTPIHCALSNEPKPRSIILSPLPVATGTFGLPIVAGQHSHNQHGKKKRYKYLSEDEDKHSRIKDITECPQVILSIRVDTEQFDLGAWLEWIKDVPPEATKVKVEGIYGSLSILLLLRMPITTWKLLPDDTAYSFIGFVTTENLAPNLQTLALKNADAQGASSPEETKHTVTGLTHSFTPLSRFSRPPRMDDTAQSFRIEWPPPPGYQKAGKSNDKDAIDAKQDHKANKDPKINEKLKIEPKARPTSTKDDIPPPVPPVDNTYSPLSLLVWSKDKHLGLWTCVSVP
jgi:hypothetical protein